MRPNLVLPEEYRLLLIVLLVVGLFYGLQLSQPYVFRSPDEAANQLFISRVADGQTLHLPSPITDKELQFFGPRSVSISNGQIRPGSFLGFVMGWGIVTRWFGHTGVLVIQLAAFLGGLVCWYRIVRRYWEPVWALSSVVLIASHPIIIQFVTLPLFHAGLFLSGMLLTGLALLRYQEHPNWRRAGIVGVAAGLALFIRPSEALWVVPGITVIMVARPNGWKHMLLTGVLVAFVQVPWILASHRLFGSFFATGYTPNGIDTGLGATSSGSSILRLLTPAGGVWNWAFLRHVWDYAIALFPAYSLATAISLAWYFRRKFIHWSKVLKIGLIMSFALYILAFYGTWELYPGALPSAFGAWNSYDRYWLPLFVGTAAGVIVLFRGVLRWSFRQSAPLMAAIVVTNIVVILIHPVAGLLERNTRALKERELRTNVLQRIPSTSILFAHGPDQIFSADIATSFYLPSSPESWQALVAMVRRAPVFFLIDARGKSVPAWNAEAQPYDLTIESVGTYNGYILAHVTN